MISQRVEVNGRRSLVIGGGTGIGLACARALCADDGRVFLSGRREAPLVTAAASLSPAKVGYATGDATEEEDMKRVVAEALEFLGTLDTVVVSAGSCGITGVMDTTLAEFSRIVNGNLFPVFLAIRHTAQHLIQSQRGSFIAISSMYGLVGQRERTAYSAAKGGTNGLIRSIALALADKGVRANAICPGFIETDLAMEMISREDDPEAVLRARRIMHPIPRAGTTDDIGAMAAFLASDGAAWITGQAFPVDGGYTAR
jgi:NAD(P)-dependent dehydrogenase (short-subunit alcohol dehydrogenase family)